MKSTAEKLELVSVTKRYGSIVAVNAINYTFKPGILYLSLDRQVVEKLHPFA